MNYCKYYKLEEYKSYNNGSTWIKTGNYEKGNLIERDSPDCGYIPPTPTGYSNQYLTFVALEDVTFSFFGAVSAIKLQYSLDSGLTWSSPDITVYTPTVTMGNKIMWKNSAPQLPVVFTNGIGRFDSSGRFNVEGNIMSLLYGDNFVNQKDLRGTGNTFTRLFNNCAGLVNAENLVLPATTLVDGCYRQMFSYCSNLTTAPSVLPATTLADDCYLYMFLDCTSLTTAPSVLPATTLARQCYYGMFIGCTSLTIAPELPATTLTETCYYAMFSDCTSLIAAPALSATTLVDDCYWRMFNGCTSLNYIKCLATDISASDCTYRWLYGVSPTGTFVKNASMNSWSTGANGIPRGWTVENV